ncbi:hypothetical protein MSAN_01798600 [Mycena sanguinolenta]|uniref:Uncharacterized protein n=1 Tax=Mycena sanguinolenta TaxID=230812 RepID=A0A8H6XUF2_9AGAR|nr:hypothetical protein MSAN_01798600 [Mycena sanguinolenta]
MVRAWEREAVRLLHKLPSYLPHHDGVLGNPDAEQKMDTDIEMGGVEDGKKKKTGKGSTLTSSTAMPTTAEDSSTTRTTSKAATTSTTGTTTTAVATTKSEGTRAVVGGYKGKAFRSWASFRSKLFV